MTDAEPASAAAQATTSYYVTSYALHVAAMVLQRLEAAYVKCIKLVFGFSRKKTVSLATHCHVLSL